MLSAARIIALASLGLAALPMLGAGSGCGSDVVATVPPAHDAGPSLPPVICRPASSPAPGWFEDITAKVLPAGADAESAPTSTGLRSGDLDGDGYPDLIATGGEGFPARPAVQTGGRRDVAGSRTRNVFMNRPDPKDPTHKARIFVDATEESHLLDTRDGKGGYAFGVASIGDVDNDGDSDVVVGPSDPGAFPRLSDDPAGVMLNDGCVHKVNVGDRQIVALPAIVCWGVRGLPR